MLNILIVDDDFSTRKLLNRILQRKAVVDHAVSGREALEAFSLSVSQCDPYDAILLDITMPDMDGNLVLNEIRSQEKNRGITMGKGVPIIMVTGRKDMMMQSFGDGCDDYLIKPFSPTILMDKIRKLVAGRQEPA